MFERVCVAGWGDLDFNSHTRKLIVPPDQMRAAVQLLARTEGVEVLPSSVK